jgi:membrane protease YdiL (CAAX protease family)
MSVSAAMPSAQPVGWLRGATAGLALFVASQVGFGLALSFVDSEPSGAPVVGAIVAAVVMVVAALGSIAIGFEWAFANRLRDMRPFGVARPTRIGSTLAIAIPSLIVAAIVAGALTTALGLDHGTTNIDTHHLSDANKAFYALLAIVAAPWIEELTVRGFLFSSLERRIGLWPAAILSGFLWAGAHFVAAVLIVFTAVGAILAFIRWRTGSILIGLILHALLNTYATSAAPESGSGAPWYALGAAAVMIVLIVIAWRWVPRLRPG